jgi:hypothetical protein
MGMPFLESVAQDRQAVGTFAEQAQPDDKRIAVQRRNARMVGLDTSPVDPGIIVRLHRELLSQQ